MPHRTLFPCSFFLVLASGFGLGAITEVTEQNGEPEGVSGTHQSGISFGEDVDAFTDRTHEYNGIDADGLPPALVGGDYVMTANDARDNGSYQLQVTIDASSTIYLLLDNRVSVRPWMTDGTGLDFDDTGLDVGYDEGGNGNGPGSSINQTASVFIASDPGNGDTNTWPPGTYTFHAQGQSGTNMYGVVVTPPLSGADEDGDGLPDEWEMVHFGSLDEDENGDLEPDGLTNVQEFNRDTDPNEADTDGDGLEDGPEFNLHATDPAVADTDQDGLDDGAELSTHLTNPLLNDTDNDALLDGEEVSIYGTDPRNEDSDGDGFGDGLEIARESDPNDPGDTPDLTSLENVVINEFMAQNQSSLLDEDGDSSDWIELWNPGSLPVSIGGWHLTDNPSDLAKWTFPTHTIPANGFLVLFASTKDRAIAGSEFHTSFALDKSGGYLALTRPDGQGGTEIIHEFRPYVSQPEDVSFGLFGETPPLPSGYFLDPTPNAANNPDAVLGFVADTRFSIDRGFFAAPQTVTISCDTPGASIIYTLDSTVPSESPPNGIRVDSTDGRTAPSASVVIDRTTVLRAFAVKADHEPTNVDTQTYIFTEDILTQGTPTQRWENWGSPGPDWDMDRSVVEHPDAASRCVAADLLDIPTLSISLPFSDMWGRGGIYISGEGVERDCSIEYLNPNGNPNDPNDERGFQIDGTVQIVGGSSTGRWKSNHLSMRVKFTEGDLRHAVFDKPWIPFGDEATDRFDTLVLDGRLNNVWNHPDHGQRVRGQYVRDQFVADLQNAIGGTAPHGRHMHVYVSGIYWGMHTVHERPDDNFAAEYFGGDNSDYDVVKHSGNTVLSGSNRFYNSLVSRLGADLTSRRNFEAAANLLDLEDFARYMLVNYFCGNDDWDHHNWYASFNRNMPGAKWHFHSWDAEHVLKDESRNSTGTNNSGKPTGFQHRLMTSPEYRLIFADLVRKEFFNGGNLTPRGAVTHYRRRINMIDRAIRAESARWGDNKRPGQPYTRGNEWLAERSRMLGSYLINRTDTVLAQFRARGWYPDTAAPDFKQHGGNVADGYSLEISSPDGGTIYYTLDGNDPREAFSGRATGETYAAPVALTSTGVVKARVRSGGGEWSAMTEALFVVGAVEADRDSLLISEVHYRPASPTPDELAAGHNRRGDFEFLELINVGPSPVDLTDVVFQSGITFDFSTDSSVIELAPGARLLIVENVAAFEFRYGTGLPVAGTFQDGTDLSNGGETLALRNNALGQEIQNFRYLDSAPWPAAPDGHGYSLTLACEEAGVDLGDPHNWRTSRETGGSPGSADTHSLADWLADHGLAPGEETGDADRDGLGAMLEYALGTNPSDPADGNVVRPRIEALSVEGQFDDYFVLTFPRMKGADDVLLTVEISDDLVTWSPAGPVIAHHFEPGNPVELIAIRSPQPVSAPGSQFMRLRVELK